MEHKVLQEYTQAPCFHIQNQVPELYLVLNVKGQAVNSLCEKLSEIFTASGVVALQRSDTS